MFSSVSIPCAIVEPIKQSLSSCYLRLLHLLASFFLSHSFYLCLTTFPLFPLQFLLAISTNSGGPNAQSHQLNKADKEFPSGHQKYFSAVFWFRETEATRRGPEAKFSSGPSVRRMECFALSGHNFGRFPLFSIAESNLLGHLAFIDKSKLNSSV